MAELVAASSADSFLESGSPTDLLELGVDPAEAYKRGLVDINFFASLALPQVMLSSLPPFYMAVWQILVTRKPEELGRILRFALGLPRGHAKTTFVKIVITWLIVYDRVTFALIICATESLAEQLLADVNDMLGSSNIEAVYGPWSSGLSTDTKELKKAAYHRRPVVLAAKGAGTALRGLNIKHARPDLIFCDDMQTRENDESPTDRIRLRRWMVATLLKVVAPRGDRLIIYAGNMYSEECILKQLQTNPGWTSLITGAILDTGEPLWPELHSLSELMESYYHDEALGEADVWFAEVMNDPKNSARSLLQDTLPVCPHPEEVVPDGVFITVDPAGFKDISDDNVVVVHGVYDGKGLILDSIVGASDPFHPITDPEKLVVETLRKALQHGASLIGVEDVGYQQTLQFWFTKYINEWQISGIEVVPLNPHGRSKESRIRLFIAELYAENYYIADTATRAAFVWQATKYKIGAKKNRDDLLDAAAYGLDIRNDYWHLVRNLKSEAAQGQEARVVSGNTPF